MGLRALRELTCEMLFLLLKHVALFAASEQTLSVLSISEESKPLNGVGFFWQSMLGFQ